MDPTARIGPGVVVEAGAFVGPCCVVGAGTRLRVRSMLVEHVTMGEGNDVHPYAVIGGDPQDRSYRPETPGEVIIGDRNVFREGVTINRGNWNGGPTRVGSGCYLMCGAHLGHNSVIGNNVTMANSACLAGHAVVGDNCVMSAFSAVHQFTEVGEGVMFQGKGAASMHVPPFVILTSENNIAGLNIVGLRRHPELSASDRDGIKRLYRAFFRGRGPVPYARVLEEYLSRHQPGPGAKRFIDFVQRVMTLEKPRNRGLCGVRHTRMRRPAEQPEEAVL